MPREKDDGDDSGQSSTMDDSDGEDLKSSRKRRRRNSVRRTKDMNKTEMDRADRADVEKEQRREQREAAAKRGAARDKPTLEDMAREIRNLQKQLASTSQRKHERSDHRSDSGSPSDEERGQRGRSPPRERSPPRKKRGKSQRGKQVAATKTKDEAARLRCVSRASRPPSCSARLLHTDGPPAACIPAAPCGVCVADAALNCQAGVWPLGGGSVEQWAGAGRRVRVEGARVGSCAGSR